MPYLKVQKPRVGAHSPARIEGDIARMRKSGSVNARSLGNAVEISHCLMFTPNVIENLIQPAEIIRSPTPPSECETFCFEVAFCLGKRNQVELENSLSAKPKN